MHQWSNCEAVFYMRSVRQLRHSIEEILEIVFSTRSVPRCYKQDNFRIQLVVRQSPGSKDVNTEVKGCAALEAVTSQQVKTQ
jgi:hypothetical protein